MNTGQWNNQQSNNFIPQKDEDVKKSDSNFEIFKGQLISKANSTVFTNENIFLFLP